MPRKSHKLSENGGDQLPPKSIDDIPTRIFMYLQAKSIFNPMEDENVSVVIELKHASNTITKLSDNYTTKNTIHLDTFYAEKPTFSVTINQDDIEDVNQFSDAPLILTLYEYTEESENSQVASSDNVTLVNSEEASVDEENVIASQRQAVAQGYIDILEFFTKTRSRSTCTIFLYPLPASSHRMSCKMEWEIYSLHPLIKELNFSNVIHVTLGSLYNIDEQLMNDCYDLTARLSFISTIPDESGDYDKVFICSYATFTKQVISDQTLNYKWENLINKQIGNEQSMGINTESKINLHKLFHELLRTDNMVFDFEEIDVNSVHALICNSLHRYILTDLMEKSLEEVLAHNQYRIMIELMREREPDDILLQGYLELPIFMYPQVYNCNFAIEMRPPNPKKPTLSKEIQKSSGKKSKRKGSTSDTGNTRLSAPLSLDLSKEKVPFAIVQICLEKPITDPSQHMIHIPQMKCAHKNSQNSTKRNIDNCEEINLEFDEFIREIVDYMLRNNIEAIKKDRQFYKSQLGNMTNKIMRLVACDFNDRIPTGTNKEFKNLMTVVYRELMGRIHELLMKCSMTSIENCFDNRENIEAILVSRMNLVKYMSEANNMEMANYVMDKLRFEYVGNPMLNFFLFLYDVEKENFDVDKEYFEKPLKEKYNDCELFVQIVNMYLNYKQALNDLDPMVSPDELLINSLTLFCHENPKTLSTWILLYYLYKKHNFMPGMEYCRWKYENLYGRPLQKLPLIPTSRWEIYLAHKIDFKSKKAQNFYQVVDLFLNLGLYQFAEWIYEEIAIEAMDVENYLVASTFKILLNKLDKTNHVKKFNTDKLPNAMYFKATLAHVNGNIDYCRGLNTEQYALLCDMESLCSNHDSFYLGILRYAYQMMQDEQYIIARTAFSICCNGKDEITFVAAIGKGRSCYKLGNLEEAAEAFAQSTGYGMYSSFVWSYLALIHLKKGENYKALECWKYARLDPDEDINKEILQELDKIDLMEIQLFVDKPSLKSKKT